MSYGASYGPPTSGAVQAPCIVCFTRNSGVTFGVARKEIKYQGYPAFVCQAHYHEFKMKEAIRNARWWHRLGRWVDRRCRKVLERILFG